MEKLALSLLFYTNPKMFSMDEHTIKLMKTPTNALVGELKQQHPMGPVIWEQTRQEADACYCKNSLIATNILDHATNS